MPVLGRGGCWLAVVTTISLVQEAAAAAAAVAAMVSFVVRPCCIRSLVMAHGFFSVAGGLLICLAEFWMWRALVGVLLSSSSFGFDAF